MLMVVARYQSILGFLLESKLIAVSTLAFAAVSGLEGKSGITLPADLLVAVELLGDGGNGGIHGSSSESEDEVKGGLLLDVVVGEGAAVYG